MVALEQGAGWLGDVGLCGVFIGWEIEATPGRRLFQSHTVIGS